jgi:hypothetical protein
LCIPIFVDWAFAICLRSGCAMKSRKVSIESLRCFGRKIQSWKSQLIEFWKVSMESLRTKELGNEISKSFDRQFEMFRSKDAELEESVD